jgi:hypothetical protein
MLERARISIGLPKLKYQKDLVCAPCRHGKMVAASHPPLTSVMIERPCELFHMDLVRARATGFSLGGQSAGTWQTVREEPDSSSVLRVLREFLRVFRSIHCAGFLLHGVRGRSVLECRTVRDGADGLLLRVQYRWSGITFRTIHRSLRTVHRTLADGPPRGRGQSAWCTEGQLSPLLLESCFRFGIVWGFVPRAGRSVVTT